MSSSQRGTRRPPADSSVSGYVRTLDVYPVKPSSSSSPHKSQTVPSSSHTADAGFHASLVTHVQRSSPPPRTLPEAPTQPQRGVHATPSLTTAGAAAATSTVPAGRPVTEEDYRLSPQEVQRSAQAALAVQLRSLLETRLQQRLQQARAAEAERLAAQQQTVHRERATAAAAAAATDSAPVAAAAPWTPIATDGGEAPRSETTDVTSSALALTDTPPFTTSRLIAADGMAAETDVTPPVVDPVKYAVTVDCYPYSAVELVRVHRLRGIPDHNRGLFAALAKRSFTTRSGHLVVNPNLEGKGRVRSAVSGYVWQEQRQQQHGNNNSSGSNVHHDAAANNASSSSAAPPSPIASSVRLGPPRLVMKVVGDGNQASFMWTEEDSSYDVVGGGGVTRRANASHSLETPLSAVLMDVLDHKYGKPLTAREKAEAERRLRERRRRDPSSHSRRSKDNNKNGADAAATTAAAAGGSAASSSGVGGGVVSSTATPSPGDVPLLLHDLLPTVYSKDGADNLTLSDDHLRSAAAGAATASTISSARLPPGSTSVSGMESPPPPPLLPSSNTGGPTRPAASHPGFSVSALDHTMSVAEAQVRQRDRQSRGEQSTETKTADGSAGTASAGQVGREGNTGMAGTSTDGPPSTNGQLHGAGSASAAVAAGAVPSSSSRPLTDTKGDLTGGRVAATSESGAPTATIASGFSNGPIGGTSTTPARHSNTTAAAAGRTNTSAKANASAAEQKQLDRFLEHFPEAESHVQLRREAKNILAEFGDMLDEDSPMSERPFPLPQFASQDFLFTDSEDDGATEAEGRPRRRHRHRRDGQTSLSSSADEDAAAAAAAEEKEVDEPVVGFEVDVAALQAKFTAEAMEDCADLAARRDALLAEAVAQRQLVRDFGDDVHFLSVGSAHDALTAEQYAIELTRDVNAYARQNHLRFTHPTNEEDDGTAEAEMEEGITLGFLERFGNERVPTRDVGCQVSDADLCYVDAAVRSTEAQLESLFHHEKALLNAVRLATVAVANILSFHASLEMEATCHECFFVFDKPRTLWPCGHTFCHACLSTMYNNRGDLICSECGSASEVGYTPNLPMELIANYQTVYTRADPDAKSAPNAAVVEEKDAQTIEGVLRNLLNDLLATQHSWKPASPKK